MSSAPLVLPGADGASILDFVVEDLLTLSSMPSIRRYRDFHAYSFGAKRYLDLWRGDGSALLGYSVPGFQLAMKNRVSQGLWGGPPHPLNTQVKKSLEKCFPQHRALICPDRETLGLALRKMGIAIVRPLVPTSLDLEESQSAASFSFRLPFSGISSLSPVSVALIPVPGMLGPYVLLIRTDSPYVSILEQMAFVSNLIPAYLMAPLHVSLQALIALGAFPPNETAPVRVRDMSQKLGSWNVSSWRELDPGGWTRTGPYLQHGFSAKRYHLVCMHALEEGVILNPRSCGLNILSGTMSDGEKKNLENVLAFVPAGGD